MQDELSGIEVRGMLADEVERIQEIDVSEVGEVVWYWKEGVYQPVAERWQRPQTYGEQGWSQRAASIKGDLAAGGAAWGALAGDRLVGFAALMHELAPDVAELTALWISASHRRRGIASRLLRLAIDEAKRTGAKAIYASTMPSDSAQGFYRSIGFEPTPFVHRDCYEMEPKDVHMILQLT